MKTCVRVLGKTLEIIRRCDAPPARGGSDGRYAIVSSTGPSRRNTKLLPFGLRNTHTSSRLEPSLKFESPRKCYSKLGVFGISRAFVEYVSCLLALLNTQRTAVSVTCMRWPAAHPQRVSSSSCPTWGKCSRFCSPGLGQPSVTGCLPRC